MEFKIICPNCGNSDFSVDYDGLECTDCGDIIETENFEVEVLE